MPSIHLLIPTSFALPQVANRRSKRLLVDFILGALLAVLYFSLHPYWFADALYYAGDVARPGPGFIDAGHLFWRPLGRVTWLIARVLVPNLDPLVPIQAISSLAASVVCIASYRLARRLYLSRSCALAVALLVAGSHSLLAFGGSGSSYIPAIAMGVLALIPLIRSDLDEPDRQRKGGGSWSFRDGALCVLGYAMGWGFWGAEALIMPMLFTAAVISSTGSPTRRLGRALILSASMVVVTTTIALITYLVFVRPGAEETTFAAWLNASRHDIPFHFSLLSVLRAVLGYISSFVYLGTFGNSVKRMIFGEINIVELRGLVLQFLAAISFLAATVFSTIGLILKARRNRTIAGPIAMIGLSAFLPLFAFAVLWQGSDIERLSPAVPFVSLALIYGASRVAPSVGLRRRELALALVVMLVNLGSFIIPTALTQGGMIMGLGRTARENMPTGSLVVVMGQSEGFINNPAPYFYGIRVHNITHLSAVKGPSGWDSRLRKALDESLSCGGKVAVLSDLLGSSTPEGIGLSEREYPVPHLKDLDTFFSTWTREKSWKIGPYTFIEVSPRLSQP